MKNRNILITSFIGAIILTGCGGGSSGSDSSSSSTGVTGTAATGSPMKSATITLKGKNGNTATATTDNDGDYSASLPTNLEAPLMVKASGMVNGNSTDYYSMVEKIPDNKIINISPATHSMVKAMGSTPENLFASPSSFSSQDFEKLQEAVDKLMERLAQMADAMGWTESEATSFDPFSSSFDADHSGFDKMLDCLDLDSSDKLTLKGTCQDGGSGADIFDPDSDWQIDESWSPPAIDSNLANFFENEWPTINEELQKIVDAFQGDDVSEVENVIETLLDDSYTNKASEVASIVSEYNDDTIYNLYFLEELLAFDATAETASGCVYGIKTVGTDDEDFFAPLSLSKSSGSWKIVNWDTSVGDESTICEYL